MANYKVSPSNDEKAELLRILQHPGSFLKDRTVNMYARDCMEINATFYISREAYDAKDAPTDELSETPDPGTEFYRGLVIKSTLV